jgi:TRAP-type transport system small permease protein
MKRVMLFIEDSLPAILLLIMVTVLSAEVIARYAFKHSLLGVTEIAEICFVWQVYLASIAVMRRRRHIAVHVLRDRLAPRGRALLDSLNNCIMAATLALVGWQAFKFVTRTNFSLLPATGLSRRTLAIAVLVGFLGMFLHVIAHLYASLRGTFDDNYAAEPESLGELDDLERGLGEAP